MTVYVQYHWDYDEDGRKEDIETAWTGDGNNSTATEDNHYLISHDWSPSLGFKIVTDNIMVTDYMQMVNVMHVYVQYVEPSDTNAE